MARTSVASQSRAHVPFTAARALRTAAARRHAPHAALRRTHTIGSSRSSVVVRATWATLDDAVAIVRSAPAQMVREVFRGLRRGHALTRRSPPPPPPAASPPWP